MNLTEIEAEDSIGNSRNLSNPNYTSVRRTQPQPTKIKLGDGKKPPSVSDKQQEDEVNDEDDFPQSSSESRPVLLANKTYEQHSLKRAGDGDALKLNESYLNANSNNQIDADQVEAILPSAPTHHAHLGIFQFMKFEHDEDNYDGTLIEALKNKNNQKPLTCKEKLRHILHSKPIHISIIILVLVDALLVIIELLYDLQVIKQHQNSETVREVLHGFSIGILSMFMIELILKLYADYRHFIHHKIEVLDAVVVTVSFVLDIILVFYNTQNIGLLAFELILLLRLWRVFRIINGLIVAVKTKADERVHQYKMETNEIKITLGKTQEKLQMQENDIRYLRSLLSEHGIKINEEKLLSKSIPSSSLENETI